MKPVEPPSLLTYGVATYMPPIDDTILYCSCVITYSPNNPTLSWITCDSSTSRIWEHTVPYSSTGILFLYETDTPLRAGFYQVALSANKRSLVVVSGQISVGLLTDTPKLVIGMPYSAYPPVTLS